MKNVYLFNPENDLVLASGKMHYTPKKMPRKMALDLASLPCWYAEEGGHARWITSEQLAEPMAFEGLRLVPWGWNAGLVGMAREAGFAEEFLPTQQEVGVLRALSNRSVSVELLCALRHEEPMYLCGNSVVCRSFEEVKHFHRQAGKTILKAPWSCSGRGLSVLTWAEITPQTQRWIQGLIVSQGSVIAEDYLNKVCDFAMEFYSDGKGGVLFCGYSLFQTDEKGVYKGNKLASDAAIEAELSSYIPLSVLQAVRSWLEFKLGHLLLPARYIGYLGVDMLIAGFESGIKYRLLPCVEINLRMNMGMLAHRLSEWFAGERREGIFQIDYFPSPALLKQNHLEQQKLFPALLKDECLRGGYQALTPVASTSQYRAAVWLREK